MSVLSYLWWKSLRIIAATELDFLSITPIYVYKTLSITPFTWSVSDVKLRALDKFQPCMISFESYGNICEYLLNNYRLQRHIY